MTATKPDMQSKAATTTTAAINTIPLPTMTQAPSKHFYPNHDNHQQKQQWRNK